MAREYIKRVSKSKQVSPKAAQAKSISSTHSCFLSLLFSLKLFAQHTKMRKNKNNNNNSNYHDRDATCNAFVLCIKTRPPLPLDRPRLNQSLALRVERSSGSVRSTCKLIILLVASYRILQAPLLNSNPRERHLIGHLLFLNLRAQLAGQLDQPQDRALFVFV